MNTMKSPNITEKLNNRLLHMKVQLDWDLLEAETIRVFAQFRHVRLMLSMLLIKKIFAINSTYRLVELWEETYAWQYFSGREYVGEKCPLLTSDLSVFESYLGYNGIEKIYRLYRQAEKKAFPETESVKVDINQGRSFQEYLMYLNTMS